MGIIFFLLTQSEAILLDGVYSLVSFFMVLFTRKVSRVISIGNSRTFHHGAIQLESLINAIRALSIIAILVFALFSAISAILHGGRNVSAGFAIIYGFLVGILGIGISMLIRRVSKQTQSKLLATDANTWFIDGVMSFGVGITFLVTFFVGKTSYQYLSGFIDPIAVCILCCFLILIPFKGLTANIKQLLLIAPAAEEQDKIQRAVTSCLKNLVYQDLLIQMVPLGKTIYLTIFIKVPHGNEDEIISWQDELSETIYNSCCQINITASPLVIFTHKSLPKLAY